MKNEYIKIILNKNNEFRALANISIPSINIKGFEDINVKIDTGCPYTSIPVQKLGVSEEMAQYYKQIDSNSDSVKKEISFGVNNSASKRGKDKYLYKCKKYMELTSITFVHTDVTLKIMNIDIDINSVKLSYDRTGNILIGMDILKDWDIHIAAVKTGETIFLACPKDQINDEYLRALEDTFGIGTAVGASLIKG